MASTFGFGFRRVMAKIASVFYRAPAPVALGDLPPAIRRKRPRPTAPLTVSRTRWYLADLEAAIRMADSGNLMWAARLYRTLRRDGVIHGLLSTRTGGLVRMRRIFTGDPDVKAALEGTPTQPGAFDELFPAPELALLAADGIVLGVGLAEMVDVVMLTLSDDGSTVTECVRGKTMRRLDPEYLRYRWDEDQWYYTSTTGEIPIIPGDGRWILHTPGGQQQPWTHGLWASLGRSFIAKDHAFLHRENYAAKLANPARVAVSPQGSTEEQRQGWFKRVMAWGVNTVFGMTPGYDVKLLESNGRGWEVFGSIIETADRENMIAVVGQTVTVDGGTGFSNMGIHETVRADLIEETGDGLAHTLNTQAIPPWSDARFGADRRAMVAYDTTLPKNLKEEADSLAAVAGAITALVTALAPFGRKPDVAAIAVKYGIPIEGDVNGDALPDAAAPPAPAANDQAPTSADIQAEAPLPEDEVSGLASKMTDHGIERCEHGRANRCWLCGIERVRDFEPGPDGPTWRVAWRPIPQSAPMQEAA